MDLKYLSKHPGPDIQLFETEYREYVKTSTGEKSRVIILKSNDSVNVLALTPDRRVVCVRQYRFGIRKTTVELPGGLLEDGEEPLHAVRRELREETGYHSDQWKYLGCIPSNPVFQDSYVHHFLAIDAQKLYNTQLDPAESIEIELMPVHEFVNILQSGVLTHPHTITALTFAREILSGI